MNDLKDGLDVLIFFIMGLLTGGLAELAARRKVWVITLQRVIAVVIGLIGALLGSLILDTVFNLLNDPTLEDVSILPALIGAVVLLFPWWLIRSGRTALSKNQKWRTNYWRK